MKENTDKLDGEKTPRETAFYMVRQILDEDSQTWHGVATRIEVA